MYEQLRKQFADSVRYETKDMHVRGSPIVHSVIVNREPALSPEAERRLYEHVQNFHQRNRFMKAMYGG